MDVTLIRIVLGFAVCFAVHANPSYRDEEASNEALNPGLKGKEAVAGALKGKLSSDELELLDDLFNAAKAERSSPELDKRELPKPGQCIERIACWPKSLKLECPVGSAIQIKDANYGRTVPYSKKVCHSNISPNPKYEVTNCYDPTSMSVVTKLCEGQTSCTIGSGTSVFGDPCVGTWKYLRVNYCCDMPKLNTCLERVDCAPQDLVLACPAGSVIHIKEANYGRALPDAHVCPYGTKHKDDTNCYASTSMSVVTKLCEGQTSCNVRSGPDVFGDPCVGTQKYMRVVYCCEIPKPDKCPDQEKPNRYFVDVACAGQVLKLECPARSVIDVVSSNYGRTLPSSQVCPYEGRHNDNTECYASRSNVVVTKACAGKSSCSVRSSNHVFGDPCYGTYKYLMVIYSCKVSEK